MGEVQQQRIPIIPDQQSGYDALGGASPFALNVVIDRMGTVRRRPGITAHPLVPTPLLQRPVVGIYPMTDGKVLVSQGNLPGFMATWLLQRGQAPLALNLVGGTVREDTASTRPTYAETERLVVIGVGRNVLRFDRQTLSIDLLGGPPPIATHVAAHGQRVLANDIVLDRTKVQFSAPAQGTTSFAGHEQWGTLTTALGTSGFITAEGRPDDVVALWENSNELWLFGTTSLQTFVPDASLTYASVTTREHGCSAPYSVIRDDQAFAWIDDKRRIVHSDGRRVTVLSDPIKASLDAMTRVDDAFGYRVHHGPTDALVWSFPSDGRALAYQREGGWATWRGSGVPFSVTALGLLPGTNENLVGTSTGAVGVMRHDALTDFGQPIDAEVITGRIDRGTPNRKLCKGVLCHVRRGQAQTSQPFAELFYRDDEGPWRGPHRLSWPVGPDTTVVVPLRSLGVYRSRQWRFRFSGTEDLALGALTEEFEILEN